MARQETSSGSILTGIGSLFAALAASACCWLPLALMAFGVSAAAVGSVVSVLEAYRPVFVGVGVVLLGSAWYFTYFRKEPRVASGKEACCRLPGKGGLVVMGRLQRLNRILLPVFTVMVLGFLLFPDRILGWVRSNAPCCTTPSAPAGALQEISIRVGGMVKAQGIT